jgi:succinylglutamate desuccinylase
MKKGILLFFLLSWVNFYCQSKDTVYVRFIAGKNCSLKQFTDKKRHTAFWIKNQTDSILLVKTNPGKDACLDKKHLSKKSRVLNACEYLNFNIKDFESINANKIIFVLIEKKKKYKMIKIDEITYYERSQN